MDCCQPGATTKPIWGHLWPESSQWNVYPQTKRQTKRQRSQDRRQKSNANSQRLTVKIIFIMFHKGKGKTINFWNMTNISIIFLPSLFLFLFSFSFSFSSFFFSLRGSPVAQASLQLKHGLELWSSCLFLLKIKPVHMCTCVVVPVLQQNATYGRNGFQRGDTVHRFWRVKAGNQVAHHSTTSLEQRG